MPPRPTRRALLSTGATVALLPVGGCLFPVGASASETIEVTVENQTDEQQSVTVRVTLENRVLLDETATVEAGTSQERSFDNPDESATATVSASTAAGRSTERSVTVGKGTGIRFIDVIVEPDELKIQAART